MYRLLAALLVLPTAAVAVPLEFSHQGRLFDASGQPIDTATNLEFKLYDVLVGGTDLWVEDRPGVPFDNGYFNVRLGQVTALDSSAFNGDTLYLGVSVNGGVELSPRVALLSVPYALRAEEADHADAASNADAATMAVEATNATNVTGGTVSASEVTVGGSLVIDSGGAVVFASLPVGTGASQVAAGSHTHTAADIGALAAGTTAADIGALPITTTAADIGALPASGLVDLSLSGNLVMPNRPAFRARGVGQPASTPGSRILQYRDDVGQTFDIGDVFDGTNLFTAPVTGLYWVHASCRFDRANVSYFRLYFSLNGGGLDVSLPHSIADFGTNWDPRYATQQISGVVRLDAGDSLQVMVTSDADGDWSHQGDDEFSAFLISAL